MSRKMAASLLRCRFAGFSLQKHARNYCVNSFYVLLPEVPSDTAETNPLMQVYGAPEFHKASPNKVITGCAKLSITYDVELGKHIEEVSDPNFDKTFESVIEPIEKWQIPLMFAASTARNMLYAVGTEHFKNAYHRIVPQVDAARQERWSSEPLYRVVQEVAANHTNQTAYQQRLIDLYLRQAKLSGLELSGKDRKTEISLHMQHIHTQQMFSNKVRISHNLFKHTITDYSQISELPKSLVSKLSANKEAPSRGPWFVSLNKTIYTPFMEYCSHRMLRWNLWQALVRRSSAAQSSDYISNHLLIDKLREHRNDRAEMLGYTNFAAMCMESKMAGSVDTVLNFIENIKSKFFPMLEEDLGQLQEFADSEGFNAALELWDIPYWRRRHKESLYNLSEADDLTPYFPYNKVLEGLFHWCKLLFGVEFKDITQSVQTWHEDVTCYAVVDCDNGEEIALVYVDPYHRRDKVSSFFTECGRERSDILNTKPISYVNLCLSPPFSKTRSTQLTLDEASNVFYEFGNVLQQCLTRVPYGDLSGQNNLDDDTVHTVPMVMSAIFYQPEVLRSISYNQETGQPLPDSTISTVIQMSQYLASYDMMHQLYLSAFDMEMCISLKYWRECMQKLWPQFVPLPLNKEDEHPCSFQEIFSGEYAGSYYSFLWSKMLAADIVASFQTAGFDDPERIAVVGRRFRDTYLSLGGAVSGSEVFRRFQGRDPTIDPLLNMYNR